MNFSKNVSHHKDLHFNGLNVYFSKTHPWFGGDPSSRFAIIDYGLPVIFPEHWVSHFITISTYLAVKRMPFLLQQPNILTRALVICTRMSRVIDWPFSTICLGFKKCLDGKGISLWEVLCNGIKQWSFLLKSCSVTSFVKMVAHVVPWYFDRCCCMHVLCYQRAILYDMLELENAWNQTAPSVIFCQHISFENCIIIKFVRRLESNCPLESNFTLCIV